jgi:pimeloyl-ACP methyl ester carboxylesterase
VGLRVGATVAGLAASELGPDDALVLWDPVVSGRRYTRQLKALQLTSAAGVHDDDATDTAIEAAGFRMSGATVDELSRLDLAKIATLGPRNVLVLERPEGPGTDALVTHLRGLGAQVTKLPAAGMTSLFDVGAVHAVPPEAGMGSITGWLAATLGAGTKFTPPDASPGTVIQAASKAEVRETPVYLGPNRMFGVLCEPVDGPRRSTAILLLNSGVDYHIGPCRLWVDVGREWAASGFRVLRIDLTGLGESGVRSGQPEYVSYAPEAIDDMAEAILALRARGASGVVAVGLCAGAYNAVYAGGKCDLAGICAINPQLYHRAGDPVRDVQAATATPPPQTRMQKVRWAVARRIPPIAWYALDRVGVVTSPGRAMTALRKHQLETLLLFGADDAGGEYLRRRGGYELRRALASPGFRMELIDGLDHNLWLSRYRADAMRVVTDYLESTFP